MNAHVTRLPAGWSDLGYPQGPGHGASSRGPSDQGGGKPKENEILGLEVKEQPDEKKQVDCNAHEGEVEPVEGPTPHWYAGDSGEQGNDQSNGKNHGVARINAIDGVCQVLHPEGNGDEVTDTHKHPPGQHPEKKPVFQGMPEIL